MFDDTPLETLELDNGNTIHIHHDFDSSHCNPREDCHTSTLYAKGLCEEGNPEDIDPKDHIYLPVYRYSHGNIALSTTPFSCPWDSGQTGFIWESKKSIREEFGVKRISPRLRKLVQDRLRSEIEVYGQWCNGEVYGFVITNPEGEEIDSCWGFIGLDWVEEAAREAGA